MFIHIRMGGGEFEIQLIQKGLINNYALQNVHMNQRLFGLKVKDQKQDKCIRFYS